MLGNVCIVDPLQFSTQFSNLTSNREGEVACRVRLPPVTYVGELAQPVTEGLKFMRHCATVAPQLPRPQRACENSLYNFKGARSAPGGGWSPAHAAAPR